MAFLLVALVALLATCGGGGGEVTAPPPSGSEIGVTPIIVSVTPKSGSPGDSITITGMYFGATQEDSKVTLNALRLTVTSWSEQEIVATLPAGATSGVIVVTVGGRTSRTSENAKIYIGTPPEPGAPMVTGLSQPSGEPTTVVTVYGLNFHSSRPDNSRVLLTSGVTEFEADVVPLTGETEGYLWSNTSIKVQVPRADPGMYSVVVVVAGVRSNDNFAFQVEPEKEPPAGQPPIIESFSPTQGAVGTIVNIVGQYFGKSRGSSVVQIGAVNMDVVLWGDTSIYAAVPAGAVPNRIRVMARGLVGESTNVFNVLLQPEITAVIPNELRVGGPLTIHGKNFSASGSIQFTPADTEDTSQRPTTITSANVTSWTDTLISLDRLPPLQSDAGVPLDVTVKTDYPEASNAVRVDVVSDMAATLKVKAELTGPEGPVEVEQAVGVAGTTSFKFYGGAGGGSGTYKFVFDFGDGSTPESHDNVAAVQGASHTYSRDGSFTPALRVTDQKQARVTVQSRELKIVAVGEPVITGIHVAQLAADVTDNANFMPNEVVGKYFGKQLGDAYCFDDSFIPLIGESEMGLQTLQYAKRQYELFAGEYTGRPIAYRVKGGSKVNITGFNLGTAGELYLAVQETTTRFNVTDRVFSPEDQMWKFTLPPLPQMRMFTGPLEIVPLAVPPITSSMPLIAQPVPASPVVPSPVPPPYRDVEVSINMNDLHPPADGGEFLGGAMYIFWAFPATRQDTMSDYIPPAGDNRYNNTYLLFRGFALDIPEDQTYVRFDLNRLFTNTGYLYNGNPVWPARNPDPAATDPIVPVLPKEAPDISWYAFLWVGSKPEAYVTTFANSGIISTLIEVPLRAAP